MSADLWPYIWLDTKTLNSVRCISNQNSDEPLVSVDWECLEQLQDEMEALEESQLFRKVRMR